MKLSNLNEETLRLKFRNSIYLPLTRNLRKKNLLKGKFTIISNNCWGGTIYESYGLRKDSPTVGMFIMPNDYLKFISNMDYYLKLELKFISQSNSKWKKELFNNKKRNYPIGKLDDIELQFLHYKDQNTAKEKWYSRIKRINSSNIIYKFNDQNGATKEDIEKFMNLPLKNKICFVSSQQNKVNDDVIYIKQPSKYDGQGIKASREPFGKSKYIDVTEYINSVIKSSEASSNIMWHKI